MFLIDWDKAYQKYLKYLRKSKDMLIQKEMGWERSLYVVSSDQVTALQIKGRYLASKDILFLIAKHI